MRRNKFFVLIFFVSLFVLGCSGQGKEKSKSSVEEEFLEEYEDTSNYFLGEWIYTSFLLTHIYDGSPDVTYLKNNESVIKIEFLSDKSFKLNDSIQGKWKLYRDHFNDYLFLETNTITPRIAKFPLTNQLVTIRKYTLHRQFFDLEMNYLNNQENIVRIKHHFLRKDQSDEWMEFHILKD